MIRTLEMRGKEKIRAQQSQTQERKPIALKSNRPSPISFNAVLVFSDSLDSATSFRRHRSNAG